MRLKLISIFILLFLVSPSVILAGFGVSPYYVYNQHLKPGSVYESEIILSRSEAADSLTITVEPEVGQISSWFSFKPGSKFTFPKGQNRFPLKVVVTVPPNADLKNYQGVIRVKATSGDDAPSGGVSVVKGARLEVDLITTNIDVSQLTVEDIKAEPVVADSKGNQKLTLHLKIKNDGNTSAGPTKVTIDFTDTLSNPAGSVTNVGSIAQIPPNTTQVVDAVFSTQLDPKEYFANTRVFLNDSLIKEDRLVITVTTPPASTGLKFPLPPSLSAITQPLYLALLFVLILGLTITLVLYRRRRRPAALVALVLTLMASVLLFVLSNREVKIKGATTVGSSSLPSLPPAPTLVPPVRVLDPSLVATFSVYERPSVTSAVVYVAQDNQNFPVLSQSVGWYQVQLPNGLNGWLPKTSVKGQN